MAPESEALPGDVIRCCRSKAVLAAGAASFAFCILFVLLFLYLRFLLRRWRWRRGGAATASSSIVQTQEQRRPDPGLDAAAIALLPSFPYRRGRDAEQAECAICLAAVDEGQVVRQLPGCMHVFHQPCVDAWFASNASCPVCRGRTEPAAARAEEGADRAPAARAVHVVEVPDDGLLPSSPTTPGDTAETESVPWARPEVGLNSA